MSMDPFKLPTTAFDFGAPVDFLATPPTGGFGGMATPINGGFTFTEPNVYIQPARKRAKREDIVEGLFTASEYNSMKSQLQSEINLRDEIIEIYENERTIQDEKFNNLLDYLKQVVELNKDVIKQNVQLEEKLSEIVQEKKKKRSLWELIIGK